MSVPSETLRPAQPGKATESQPRRSRRSLKRAGAVALLVLLAILGVAYWATRPTPAPRYETIAVAKGAVSRAVTATGTVNPVLTILVGTYVSGVIQEISCDFNTKVTKGQLCAKIDPRPYQTALDQAKANLNSARAQLAKDDANLAYAKLNADRLARLAKLDSASRDAADSAASAHRQAEAQIELDKASIDQHTAALAAAQVNLDYTNIVSPVDGTVVSRNVTIGQTVAASFQTPTLFLIATDLTKMQLDTNVSESDIGGIVVGDKVSFTVEAFPSQTFAGQVIQVRQAPQTVQNVVTYDVVVSVDNSAAQLKPGMTATVRIITASRDNVLRVPNQALRFAPSGGLSSAGRSNARPTQVWVLRNGQAVPVAVKAGLDDDSNTEIVEGELKEGDPLIIGEQRSASAAVSRPRLFGFF